MITTSHQLQRLGQVSVNRGDYNLEVVDSFSYLDLVLSSRLGSSYHVAYIKAKVCHILDVKTAITLYKMLIQHVLDYVDFIYFSFT